MVEIGEKVSCISTFPGVSSQCAFSCPSGAYGIINSATNEIVCKNTHELPIFNLSIDEQNNAIYFADERCAYRFDSRTNEKPQFILQLISNIISISSYGNIIAASTLEHGIILGDCRKLEKINKGSEKSTPATSMCFIPSSCKLLAGYQDSNVGEWETMSGEYTPLDLPPFLHTHGLEAHNCFVSESFHCVGYSSGISIYKDGKVSHETLNKSCLFTATTSAPCFGESYAIAALNDGSIIPFHLGSLSEEGILSFHSDPIINISANSLMIAVSYDDEDGEISIVTPEDFNRMKQ